MNALARFHARYPQLFRSAWVALLLFLAACNTSDSGGGGIY